MAATLAHGTTTISNAAREPEIIDLCDCLVKMGAKITGAGTSSITIEGIKELSGCEHEVIPDRLETITYAIASILTGGGISLAQTKKEFFHPLTDCFSELTIQKKEDGFQILGMPTEPVHLSTAPYPGLATDLQAQMMVLATQIRDGRSTIQETIYENRFMHVPELCRMSADITVFGHTATINGGIPLSGPL